VATLTAATLVIAGVLVYAIELQRLEEQTLAAVDQELQEFDRIQSEGVDPTTAEPFTDVAAMLELFFQRNIPDDDELLVGWISARPDPVRFVSPEADPPEADPLVDDPAFLDAAAEVASSGGSRRLEIDGDGEVLVVGQPVRFRSATEGGALLVVTRLDVNRAALRDTMRTYAIVSALALLLVAGVAFALTGRLLSPLRRLRRTAEEISELDLTRRIPVTGNDDITALTGTVNTMLDRLESAFTEQRRFLDDAGHELRTPLTVLRGHLEVLDPRSPVDVDETRALLLDEVDRMSRLVGDLILLAKSDRPDFVRVARVDLRDLTEDLLAKCSGLGGREWLLDAAGDASIEVDAQRLTQAVLQLAHNAVRHTSEGDPVAIGSAYDGTRLLLWVRDTGPGLAPDDRTRVFGRFARAGSADSADSADHDGFGLGLSIVSAIAEAHGGSARWEDPGHHGHPSGSRFVVDVPAVRVTTDRGADPEEDTWPGS
jgi:two-component system OmpR family sensor kinase